MTTQDSPPSEKYSPIARIGSGGMADVYLTQVTGPSGFRKLAVVKRPHVNPNDDDFLRMFLAEARVAARLNHPNIVNTFEVGEDEKGNFIAMEFLEGQPLDRILRRAGTDGFPLALSLHVIIDVLTAIHYAHELRDYDQRPLDIVHRDVTPQNIFVLYTGQAKLVDFGIAKTAGSAGMTKTGVLKGKLGYMPPEQVRSETLDRRADIYAVGVMLWEALTRRRLWAGRNEMEILDAMVSEAPPPKPTELRPDVPPELEAICMKALAPKRDDRFATAADFETALDAAVTKLGLRSSAREVGRAVEDAFRVEQTRMRNDIEVFIKGGPVSSTLPVIDVDERTPVPVVPSRTATKTLQSEGADPPSPRRSRALMFVVAALLAAGLAVSAFVLTSHRQKVATVAPPVAVAPPAPTPAPPAPAPAAPEIRVELSATPESAQIFLDDVRVPNPYRTHRTPDGNPHTVRVVESGFITRTMNLDLRQDAIADVALSPAPVVMRAPTWTPRRAPPPAPAPAAPAPAPAPAPETAPAPARPAALDDPLALPPPKKKPPPPIDTTPWQR